MSNFTVYYPVVAERQASNFKGESTPEKVYHVFFRTQGDEFSSAAKSANPRALGEAFKLFLDGRGQREYALSYHPSFDCFGNSQERRKAFPLEGEDRIQFQRRLIEFD